MNWKIGKTVDSHRLILNLSDKCEDVTNSKLNDKLSIQDFWFQLRGLTL